MDYRRRQMSEMNKATGNRQQAEQSPAVWTAKQVAAHLNISVRQVWRLNSTGRLPKPVRIGSCVRFRTRDIINYVDMRCPNREAFEANQKTL